MKSDKKFSLAPLLDAHLDRTRNAPRTYVSKPGLKPSELSSPCLRKNYYVYHKLPSNFPWPVDNIKAKEAGDACHTQYRKLLKEAGFLIENIDSRTGEVPLSFIDQKTPDPEYPVYDPDMGIRYAKADGIIKIPDGEMRGLWVLEIKSKKSEKYKKVQGPDRDLLQGNYYVFKLEEQLQEGRLSHIEGLSEETEIRGSVYFYINRDTGEYKDYFVEKDYKALEEFVTRAVTTLDFVEKKQLPPKTRDFCPWCPYRDRCEQEYKVQD